MPLELGALAIMTLFFLWAWLPGSLAKRKTYGREYLYSNRDATALPPLPPWAERSNRAYENLKSYFPAFAVAILALGYEGKSDCAVKSAAVAYVIARVMHYCFYTGGIVRGRAAAWVVGILANTYLLIRIF